jgi:putative addiction module component (TIGR02574 family)
MDTVERLQLMETIWDSLLYDEVDIESPEWHKDVLSDRKKKIEDGTAEFVSIKELRADCRCGAIRYGLKEKLQNEAKCVE